MRKNPAGGNMSIGVDAYLEQQKSPQKEICQKLRRIILKTIPGVSEEMKWGVPTYAGGKYYFVALKNQVNLGLSLKELPKEEQKVLQGSGKTMKHITIRSLDEFDEERIVEFLKLVRAK
jgi:hypothetical protein